MPDAEVPAEPRHRFKYLIAAAIVAAGAQVAAFATIAIPSLASFCWIAILLVPGALAIAARNATSKRQLILVLFVTQYPTWLVLDQWIGDISVLGWPAKSFYSALWPILFALAFRRCDAAPRLRAIPRVVLVATLWTGIEVFRGSVFLDGYAWYLIAHPLVQWPLLAQTAAIGGAYMVSFVAAAFSALAVTRARREIIVATVLVIASIAYGATHQSAMSSREDEARTDQDTQRILVMQTNLEQSLKMQWGPDQQQVDVVRWIEATWDAALEANDAGTPVDAAVWPETMLPGFGPTRDMIAAHEELGLGPGDAFVRRIMDLSEAIVAPVVVGSAGRDGVTIVQDDEGAKLEWERITNSAFVIARDGPRGRSDKRHLTPFGEWMPIISNWPWLEQRLLAFGAQGMRFELVPGDDIVTLPVGDARWATPICFEATSPATVRTQTFGADGGDAHVIVNLTNDGWFGDSVAGRLQHAQIARFRAIETGRSVVRVANTGISVVIDPTGVMRSATDAGMETSFVADVPLMDGRTIYARGGHLWSWIVLTGAGIAVIAGLMPIRSAVTID